MRSQFGKGFYFEKRKKLTKHGYPKHGRLLIKNIFN